MTRNLNQTKSYASLILFEELAHERNHTISSMVITNKKQTKLNLKCNKCNTCFETTGHNYSRAGGKATEANLIPSENKHFFPY